MHTGKNDLARRKQIARIIRENYEEEEKCPRCGLPNHGYLGDTICFQFPTIHYDRDEGSARGIEVLCADCWNELSPVQRVEYFKEAFDGSDELLANPENIDFWEEVKAEVMSFDIFGIYQRRKGKP